MERIKDISLAFKCPIAKPELIKDKKGFFCQHCSNHLIDFTSKCRADLENEINNSSKSVCGLFNMNQLSARFLQYAAASLIVTSCVTFVSYGQENPKSPTKDVTADSKNEDIVFGMLEVSPEPIGGYIKFMEALSKELKFPKGLKTKGKCFVQFNIDSTGHVDGYQIIKSLSPEADAEALRALRKLNYPFKPSSKNDNRFILPIAFDPDRKKKH
jgi:TonB family protein